MGRYPKIEHQHDVLEVVADYIAANGGGEGGSTDIVVEPSGLTPGFTVHTEDGERKISFWFNEFGDTALWVYHDSSGNDTRGIIKLITESGFESWQSIITALDKTGNLGAQIGGNSSQGGAGFANVFMGENQNAPGLLVQDFAGNYVFKVLRTNISQFAGFVVAEPSADGTSSQFKARGSSGDFGAPNAILSAADHGEGNLQAQLIFDNIVSGEVNLRALPAAVFFRLTAAAGQSDSDPILRVHDENDNQVLDVFNSGTVRLSHPTGATFEVGADGIKVSGLPTSDPTIDGALWNNSGVLTISAG